MKFVLSGFFILAVIFSPVIIPAQHAHAETAGGGYLGISGLDIKDNAAEAAANAETQYHEYSGRAICGIFSLSGWAGCLAELLFWISSAMGILLGIVGIAFNYVIFETVSNMSLYINDSTLSVGILTAWSVLRDLGNIVIIGGLVFIALGTIFGLKTYNSNLLAGIIIAAILVNFSYFITAVVIDTSNLIAIELYKSFVGTSNDVSSNFMQGAKLERLSSADTFNAIVTSSGNNAALALAYAAMLIVFYGVTIYVFLNALVLFIARFVSLTLILISSPLGIVGRAIPYSSKYADMWWKALASQALFAPIFFLLIGIAFKIQEGIVLRLISASGNEVSAGISNRLGGNDLGGFVADIATSLFTFSIASMFMYLALRIAKGMSAEAAELKPVYDFISKTAGRATTWPTGLVASGAQALVNAAETRTWGRAITGFGLLNTGLENIRGAKFGASQSFAKDVEGLKKLNEGERQRIQGLEKKIFTKADKLGQAQELIRGVGESDDSFKERQKAAQDKANAAKEQYLRNIGETGRSEEFKKNLALGIKDVTEKMDARKLELLIKAWDKNRKGVAESEFPTLNAEVVAILNKHNITMSKDLKKLHEDLVLARKDANNKALTEKERIKARVLAEEKMQEIETEENSIQKKYSDTIAKLERDIQKSQDLLRSGGAALPERQREFLVKEVDRLRTEKSQSLDMQREYEHAKATRDSARDTFAKPPEFK